jgi:hypothetical protein
MKGGLDEFYKLDLKIGLNLATENNMMKKSGVKISYTGWSILGALILAGLLFVGFLMFMANLRSPNQPQYYFSTAVITFLPAPTLTPVVSIEATDQPNETATSEIRPTLGGISIGVYVIISGTDGNGLNLREGPGTSNKTITIGMDAETFLVKDGPQEADGYTWWFLQAPYDETRNGWAAADYLTVLDTLLETQTVSP